MNTTPQTKDQKTIIIDTQQQDDLPAILTLNECAFNGKDEARLVETLSWQTGFDAKLSRVAKIANQVVGHILFSELYSDSNMRLRIVALAPMAVLPEYQGQGVGGALIDEGFALLENLNYAGVIVLGDTAYYNRHGFTHELVAHIQSPYQSEHYMGYEFLEGAFSNIHEVRYPAAFSAFENTEEVIHTIEAEEADDLPSSEMRSHTASQNETSGL